MWHVLGQFTAAWLQVGSSRLTPSLGFLNCRVAPVTSVVSRIRTTVWLECRADFSSRPVLLCHCNGATRRSPLLWTRRFQHRLHNGNIPHSGRVCLFDFPLCRRGRGCLGLCTLRTELLFSIGNLHCMSCWIILCDVWPHRCVRGVYTRALLPCWRDSHDRMPHWLVLPQLEHVGPETVFVWAILCDDRTVCNQRRVCRRKRCGVVP